MSQGNDIPTATGKRLVMVRTEVKKGGQAPPRLQR